MSSFTKGFLVALGVIAALWVAAVLMGVFK
jgi:hypothetical protein